MPEKVADRQTFNIRAAAGVAKSAKRAAASAATAATTTPIIGRGRGRKANIAVEKAIFEKQLKDNTRGWTTEYKTKFRME